MSNLLNNNRPKKKLLDRGPKITPAQEFKLEESEIKEDTPPKLEKVQKKNTTQSITSVRVTKATRNKLNALVQLDKAESADVLIDILIDAYVDINITKEEKRTYDIILQVLNNKKRS